MTEIYFIRHAQAEGNLYNMLQGHWDGNVTELGARQIDALAERFRDIKVDALYTSDLLRTRRTASAITRYHDIAMHEDRRLREINVGPWETQFFGNAMHDSPEEMRRFLIEPESFSLPGAETYGDVTERAMAAVKDIAAANSGKCVAIVSHGITLRCIMARLTGTALNEQPLFGNTGVAHVFYDGETCEVDFFNSTEHLTPELTPARQSTILRHEFIDPAAHEDYYKSCYEDAWRTAHGSLRGYNAQTYYLAALEHYRQDAEAVSVIYDRDVPAGLIDLDTARGAHALYGWVSLLYLNGDYRGKGCGIQLLARAIEKYRALGRHAIRLHVSEDNEAAEAFYRRWGFERLSYEQGAGARLWLMEKKI